jgi:hypothetical protein
MIKPINSLLCEYRAFSVTCLTVGSLNACQITTIFKVWFQVIQLPRLLNSLTFSNICDKQANSWNRTFFYSILSWTLNSPCLHQQKKTGSKSNRPNQWSEHYRTDPVDLLYINYSKVTAWNVTKTYGEMEVELQSFLASALLYMERSGKLQGAGRTPQTSRSVATAWN